MSLNTVYVKSIRYPFRASQFRQTRGMCTACGADDATFVYNDVISDDLASEWGVNKSLQKAYSQRESMHCSECRCSARLRAQARALTILIDESQPSLQHAIVSGGFNDLKVAEINACGDLHSILAGIKRLSYSEYAPKDKKIQKEDLHKLSYGDAAFDYVLTSDTLEHVPEVNKALSEIYRVLRPGGYHVFTVPLIFSRLSRRRIVADGEVSIKLGPSYHGSGEPDNIVVTEFGIDFIISLNEAGFSTNIYFGNPINKNEVNYVLVSRREP